MRGLTFPGWSSLQDPLAGETGRRPPDSADRSRVEREDIHESTLEGRDAATRTGKHGGRPPAVTEDILHTVLRRRANGESV